MTSTPFHFKMDQNNTHNQYKIITPSVQRYGSERYSMPLIAPSLDISQYSDSGSYIVAELESEPLRRGIPRHADTDKPPRKNRAKGNNNNNNANSSSRMIYSSPSSSSNVSSSKLTQNGFSPSKSTNDSIMNEVLENQFLSRVLRDSTTRFVGR